MSRFFGLFFVIRSAWPRLKTHLQGERKIKEQEELIQSLSSNLHSKGGVSFGGKSYASEREILSLIILENPTGSGIAVEGGGYEYG